MRTQNLFQPILPLLLLAHASLAATAPGSRTPVCNSSAPVSRWIIVSNCQAGDSRACDIAATWRSSEAVPAWEDSAFLPDLQMLHENMKSATAASISSRGLSPVMLNATREFSNAARNLAEWCVQGHQRACAAFDRYDAAECRDQRNLRRAEAYTNARVHEANVNASVRGTQDRMEARNDAGRYEVERDYQAQRGNAAQAAYYDQKAQEERDFIRRSEERSNSKISGVRSSGAASMTYQPQQPPLGPAPAASPATPPSAIPMGAAVPSGPPVPPNAPMWRLQANQARYAIFTEGDKMVIRAGDGSGAWAELQGYTRKGKTSYAGEWHENFGGIQVAWTIVTKSVTDGRIQCLLVRTYARNGAPISDPYKGSGFGSIMGGIAGGVSGEVNVRPLKLTWVAEPR